MSTYFAPKWRHWKPYTGPRSPTARSVSPIESRYSRDALPSQILIPLSCGPASPQWSPIAPAPPPTHPRGRAPAAARRTCSVFAFVSPEMNHRSSSATPRQNTRFVVSTGSTPLRSEKRSCVGAHITQLRAQNTHAHSATHAPAPQTLTACPSLSGRRGARPCPGYRGSGQDTCGTTARVGRTEWCVHGHALCSARPQPPVPQPRATHWSSSCTPAATASGRGTALRART